MKLKNVVQMEIIVKEYQNCLYTCLVGDYENLPEQEFSGRCETKFICFTDNPNLKSDSWEIRLISPILPFDPIRSQRWVKINPHRVLPEYARSIYIDATVTLKQSPDDIFKRAGDAKFSLMRHSYRDNVLDEFLEVSRLGFDDQGRIFEQMNHYLVSCPEIMDAKPYWCGLMIRDHHDEQVQRLCDTWSTHVMRYSRRDQLSLNAACIATGYQPADLPGDNFETEFHLWNSENRDRNKSIRDPRRSLIPVQGQIRDLQRGLEQKDKLIELLEKRGKGADSIQDLIPQAAGETVIVSTNEDTHLRGPKRRLVRQRSLATDHAALGAVTFEGINDAGRRAVFAEDYAIARTVAEGEESGERWFEIGMNGKPQPGMVIAKPNADHETLIFLTIKTGSETILRRILIEDNGDGTASLKIKLTE